MRGPPWGVQGLFWMSIWPACFLLPPFTPATATVFLRGGPPPDLSEPIERNSSIYDEILT